VRGARQHCRSGGFIAHRPLSAGSLAKLSYSYGVGRCSEPRALFGGVAGRPGDRFAVDAHRERLARRLAVGAQIFPVLPVGQRACVDVSSRMRSVRPLSHGGSTMGTRGKRQA
jgi:hypothetical protein